MQVSGEAVYVDDIPRMKDEIHIAFVISKYAFAKILNIEPSKALQSDDVVGFYCAKDIAPSNNKFTMVVAHDEWLFADDFVHCQGQIIGVVGMRYLCLKKLGINVYAKCQSNTNYFPFFP